MSSPHFRDYHLLLDEHADQIFAMTDAIAERARKLDGDTLRSIGEVARHQWLLDNDQQSHSPRNCLRRLLQS
jgi:starvation-inducible DNA-binding protein